MIAVEKKRQEEMDSKMNVSINLSKGTTDLVVDEQDSMFSFANQNQQTNQYLNLQSQQNKNEKKSQIAGQSLNFKPFSVETGEQMQINANIDSLQ